MPISKQEADRLVEARKAAREAIDARLDAMMTSLFQSLQAGSDGGLIHEIVSFARQIDYSILCRPVETDMEYEDTIFVEISGKTSKAAEDMLCYIYEAAGWFLVLYRESSVGGPYVEVRGFDIAQKAECLADAALAEQEKRQREQRRTTPGY